MSSRLAESHATDLMAGRRHTVTVAEFHRMAEAGILTEDDRVELIEGEMIEMTPIGSHHAGTVKRLLAAFDEQLKGAAIVSVQDPIVLAPDSEPQPDLSILRYRDDYYTKAHPGPGDILLVIEVADTTAKYDREVKLPLYARHDIPEVWLVDLEEGRLEVHNGPETGEYRHVDYHRSGEVAPLAFPDMKISMVSLGLG